ncbi:hypothetical protein DFS33DRAFT_453596 [Desarmillaria ectypa]|nr:hypothetical protein DFS33DRAFT_453596 [Desarmillaria ectypa]
MSLRLWPSARARYEFGLHFMSQKYLRNYYATVSPTILPHPRMPDHDKLMLPTSLDKSILAHLSASSVIPSLHELIHQYEANSGHILDCSLPYESRPSESRQRHSFPSTSGDSNIVMITHCVKTHGDHKVSLSSGFALETLSASPGKALFLTCAHTLEEMHRSPLLLFNADSSSRTSRGTRGIAQKSGTFVISGSPERQQIHPISAIPSAIPRSDLLELACSKAPVQTLAVSSF